MQSLTQCNSMRAQQARKTCSPGKGSSPVPHATCVLVHQREQAAGNAAVAEGLHNAQRQDVHHAVAVEVLHGDPHALPVLRYKPQVQGLSVRARAHSESLIPAGGGRMEPWTS